MKGPALILTQAKDRLFMLQVDEGPVKDTAKVSATAPLGLVRLRLEQEALRANGRAQPESKTHNHHLHKPKESITKSQPPASLPLPYHAKSPAPMPARHKPAAKAMAITRDGRSLPGASLGEVKCSDVPGCLRHGPSFSHAYHTVLCLFGMAWPADLNPGVGVTQWAA